MSVFNHEESCLNFWQKECNVSSARSSLEAFCIVRAYWHAAPWQNTIFSIPQHVTPSCARFYSGTPPYEHTRGNVVVSKDLTVKSRNEKNSYTIGIMTTHCLSWKHVDTLIWKRYACTDSSCKNIDARRESINDHLTEDKYARVWPGRVALKKGCRDYDFLSNNAFGACLTHVVYFPWFFISVELELSSCFNNIELDPTCAIQEMHICLLLECYDLLTVS